LAAGSAGPGDFLGFTAGDEYDYTAYTAEAVAEGTVLASGLIHSDVWTLTRIKYYRTTFGHKRLEACRHKIAIEI
jgi:hypothetical protein